jgi:hypothetical protein
MPKIYFCTQDEIQSNSFFGMDVTLNMTLAEVRAKMGLGSDHHFSLGDNFELEEDEPIGSLRLETNDKVTENNLIFIRRFFLNRIPHEEKSLLHKNGYMDKVDASIRKRVDSLLEIRAQIDGKNKREWMMKHVGVPDHMVPIILEDDYIREAKSRLELENMIEDLNIICCNWLFDQKLTLSHEIQL